MIRQQGDLLTTGFVANYCGATPISVARWIKAGKLKAIRTPGGRFRISRADFRQFLEVHQMPIDESLFVSLRRRILVVDDDPAIVTLIKRAFESTSWDYELVAVDNGYEAGLQAARFHPHLVILDIMMPGLSGLEVCRRIRSDSQLGDTRIMVLTGYATPENQARAQVSGADLCLAKPMTLGALLQAAGQLLGLEEPVLAAAPAAPEAS